MLPLMFAQAGAAWTLAHWAILVVVVIAIVAIVVIALRQAGVAIPGFVVQIFWILCAAALCIFAIKFLMGLA